MLILMILMSFFLCGTILVVRMRRSWGWEWWRRGGHCLVASGEEGVVTVEEGSDQHALNA